MHATPRSKPRPAQRRSPRRCGELVGEAAATLQMFEKIALLAPETCPVLVRGETGTGKELVARALHQLGRRRAPWVALNCAAISESLAASELFGHERGAFTGAVAQHRGAFERAHGGTLFLDEIGELPLGLQAQLLRVLETREVVRVGGDRPVRVDFRLVAATHRSLEAEVAAGRFRQDLLFRIRVARIRVLPLRERLDDLPVLVAELLRRLDPTARCTPKALDTLRWHLWPGNVRELSNVLQRARLAAGGPAIGPEHIKVCGGSHPYMAAVDGARWRACEPAAAPWGTVRVQGRHLQEIERDVLAFALRAAEGNQAQAARSLGVARQTFNDRVHRLGLVPAHLAPRRVTG